MLTEKALKKNIEILKKELKEFNLLSMQNPLRWHWWTKWRYRNLSRKQEHIILYIIVFTVALDLRYRNGNWRVVDTVTKLIEKGLASD